MNWKIEGKDKTSPQAKTSQAIAPFHFFDKFHIPAPPLTVSLTIQNALSQNTRINHISIIADKIMPFIITEITVNMHCAHNISETGMHCIFLSKSSAAEVKQNLWKYPILPF